MGDSATLTVPLPAETTEKLAALASLSRRASSSLAAEAIAGYVARELTSVAAIESGQQDSRVAPHAAVMAEVRAIIAEVDLKP
jgi:predicted transcriptional regulator